MFLSLTGYACLGSAYLLWFNDQSVFGFLIDLIALCLGDYRTLWAQNIHSPSSMRPNGHSTLEGEIGIYTIPQTWGQKRRSFLGGSECTQSLKHKVQRGWVPHRKTKCSRDYQQRAHSCHEEWEIYPSLQNCSQVHKEF